MSDIGQFYADIKVDDIIIFMYTNWKGVTSKRKAIVKGFFFGATDYHNEYQCFIKAFDLDKLAYRDFAVRDITAIEVVEI
jgi:hypothetical protein